MNQLEQEEEHFSQVGTAFLTYQTYFKNKYKAKFQSLPIENRKQQFYSNLFKQIISLLEINQLFLSQVFNSSPFKINFIKKDYAKSINYQKLSSTLRQFVRQWSQQGKQQREQSFGKILKRLKKEERNGKVLIPGCGLGRLVYQVGLLGFQVQGNQYQYFMLLGSNLILNILDRQEYRIHCNLDKIQYLQDIKSILKQYKIPDIQINVQLNHMQISSGDFLTIYNSKQFKYIITSFFLDTAHNIIQYIHKIYAILLDQGLWINLGPLLYHYQNHPHQVSLHLTWQELRKVISKYFVIHNFQLVDARYCSSQNTIQYQCIYFQAQKII